MLKSLTFPKNIYQVWFQGCENITNKEFVLNKTNWELMNPTWNYYCLSNKDLENACKLFSKECHDIYKSLPIMHMKIDLGRYVYVYLYGGMYIDMDAYVLRNLDSNVLINKIISIYEKENKHCLGLSMLNFYKFEKMISGIKYNNAFMISSPKNPLVKKMIQYILEQCKKYKDGSFTYNAVQYTTGPISFNNFFKTNTNEDSIIIEFKKDIFEPCDLNHNCQITKDTLAIHQFEMTWVSPFMKYLGKCYFYLRNNWIIIILLIILFFKCK